MAQIETIFSIKVDFPNNSFRIWKCKPPVFWKCKPAIFVAREYQQYSLHGNSCVCVTKG
jgi:hypothetical protein